MATDDNLNIREKVWRKALWALADLIPGDSRATDPLDILDDIDRHDLRSQCPSVPATERPGGILIVRDADIPQPWRERFQCASRGSTRVIEGAYYHDWEKFMREWKVEIMHLEAHRRFSKRY
ncbi:UNVERIFIED_ORG: hypothetical protein J2W65_002478 [Pseudomonas parafulva]|nr:hypothetical protein [Pseudomonas parafulva]